MRARGAIGVLLITAIPVVGAFTTACGDGNGATSNAPSSPISPTPPAPTVTAISVTGSSSFTAAGQSGQLVATATLSNGTSQTVTSSAAWQSSNPGVVSVSAAGVVLAVAPGTATVMATYQGLSGTVQISWNYTIDPSPYLRIETGGLPVVISVAHGGTLDVPGVPVRTSGTTITDLNTLELATSTQSQLQSRTGQRASLVAALVSREYIELNQTRGAAFESPAMASVYDAYYVALSDAVATARGFGGQRAILVDIHGQSESTQVVFRGTRNGQTANLSFLYGQPGGLLTRLMALNVSVSPPTASGTENPSFNGGNIVVRNGLSAGGIQAVQLEFGRSYRQTAGAFADAASKLADAIVSAINCSTCR